jgi:hypothetical protein
MSIIVFDSFAYDFAESYRLGAGVGFRDFWLLLLIASFIALVCAQTCHCAWRRLLFSASPEKSNQKRGDFFRRSNLVLCRAGLCCNEVPARPARGAE